MEIDYTLLGNRIKTRRINKNLRQSQLAEMLNISNNHLSAIENGREKPSLDLLFSICEMLETTPDYMLLGCPRINNTPKALADSLKLCSESDIQIISGIVNVFIERYQK